MKPILALLPTDEITRKIYQLRNELINRGWGVESDRIRALPHLSLSYLKEIDDNTVVERLKRDLANTFTKFEPVTLNVVKARTWSNKISLMFDNKPVRKLVIELETLLGKYGISDSKDYLSQLNQSKKELGEKTYASFEEVAGDHIKIVFE